MKCIKEDQFKIMPWKNGGGITTELYSLPAEEADQFKLRLSRAKINKDGPFSLFKGIDRHLLVVEGAGCILQSPHESLVLTQDSPPYFFAGETIYQCKLINGPVIDFNLMIDRSWGTAQITLGSYQQLTKILCKSDLLLFFDFTKNELYVLKEGEEFESDSSKFLTVTIDTCFI